MADPIETARRLRAINDALRREMPHGSVIISRSVGQMFSNDQLRDITELIRHYDAFGSSDDQEEWHDHGTVEYGETSLAWGIDTWDAGLNGAQADQAASMAVRRRISITLANGYVDCP